MPTLTTKNQKSSINGYTKEFENENFFEFNNFDEAMKHLNADDNKQDNTFKSLN